MARWTASERRPQRPPRGPPGRPEEANSFEGATVTLTRGVAIPGMAFWHDSRSSRRNNQADPWRWENVLACFTVFKRLSSNE
eukprot:500861-Pyramimonas_sp.AAC.1